MAASVVSHLGHVAQSDETHTKMTALGALGNVVLAVPDTAVDILLIAGTARNDKDSSVRRVALKTAANACRVTACNAPECLTYLVQGLRDADWQVRDTCVQAFGDVSKTDPEVGNVSLQKLADILQSGDENLRQDASRAIAKVLHACPHLAG